MRKPLTAHHYGGKIKFRIRLTDPPLPLTEAGDTPVVMVPPSYHPTVPAFMEGESDITVQQHIPNEKIHLAHPLALPISGYIMQIQDSCKKHGINYLPGKGLEPCVHALWAMESYIDEPRHRVGFSNEEDMKTLIFTPEKAYWINHPTRMDEVKIGPGIFATAIPLN